MNNSEAIFKFDELAQQEIAKMGGGSSLPEVTSEDNGKVLAVVEGKWDKAESGGSVVVTLGEESLFALGTAMEAFYTAALADAGAFVSVSSVGGLSEVTEIITYLQQGKTVFVDMGALGLYTKIEIVAYQDVNPIGIQASIAGFAFPVTESVRADSMAAVIADADHIKINGLAIIAT